MNTPAECALVWSHLRNDVEVLPLQQVLSINREAYRDNQPDAHVIMLIGRQPLLLDAAELCRATLAARTFGLDGVPQ